MPDLHRLIIIAVMKQCQQYLDRLLLHDFTRLLPASHVDKSQYSQYVLSTKNGIRC